MHPLHRVSPLASSGNNPTDRADGRRRASVPTPQNNEPTLRASRAFSEIEWDSADGDSDLGASAISQDSSVLYDLKNDGRFPESMKWESTGNFDVSERSNSESEGPSGTKKAPTRFDSTSIDRIGDIGDDEEEEESDRDDSSAHAASRRRRPFYRQLLVVVLVVGIIVGASVGIGLLVTDGDPLARRSAALELQEAQRQDAQRLLELAESVVVACGHGGGGGIAACRRLCEANMCCIDHEDPCNDGISRKCVAYAGCMALLDRND